MIFLFGELLAFMAELFFIGAATKGDGEESQREARRQEREREVLERAARLLDGTVYKPWFRKRRIEGAHRGREVYVIWRGKGRVEVRCRAPVGVELKASVPVFSRLFGDREPRVLGNASHLAAGVFDLFRRFGLDSLEVENGVLEARGRPGFDAEHIADMARQLSDLVWDGAGPNGPPIRVATPASPLVTPVQVQVNARPTPPGGRCPFCHDDLLPDKPVVHCDACDAPHHPSCFEEGEGCSIQGCQHRKARGVRA